MSVSHKLSWNSPLTELYKGKKLPKSVELLKEAGIISIIDLAWIFPNKFYPIKHNPKPQDCLEGEFLRVEGKLKNINIRPIFSKKFKLFNISGILNTDSGSFKVIWFNTFSNIKAKISDCYSNQKEIILEGPFSLFGQTPQITNPKFKSESTEDDEKRLVYPTLNKVKGRFIEGLVAKIPFELWHNMPEIPKSDVLLKESLKTLHNIEDLLPVEKAVERIKSQEFLLDQLKIHLRKKNRKSINVLPVQITNSEINEAKSLLPYKLTDGQLNSIREIVDDLASGYPLSRLIQGDVGCGKTSVAMVMAKLLNNKGYQVALMAPTENLANQHFQNLRKYFKNISLVTSSVKGSDKKDRIKDISEGKIDLVIGTHSLFQEAIHFKKLGLSIIDEQHKFGANQRVALVNKSELPHFLLMTATPIPRTLRLTQYGDLDVSIIKEMPAGRKGHQTRVINKDTFHKFLSFLKTRIDMGEQAYIVLPNIEKSEFRDTYSVDEILQQYKNLFPDFNIKSLHGKMPSSEQFEILSDFKNKKIQVVISTTVVEVGIHVSNATIMAIYNPEMFGLSSLHQLRGRVGRDEKPGFCFLLALNDLNSLQEERLKIFETTSDGFEIAEADLKFRGEGDLFGAKQSGYNFERRLSHPVEDKRIFEEVVERSKSLFQDEQIIQEQAEFFNFYQNDYINNYV